MDLSKLSDEELTALEHGDLSKLSDEALDAIGGQEPAEAQGQAPKKGIDEELMDKVPAPIKNILGGISAYQNGLVKAGTFGNLKNPLPGTDEIAKEHPVMDAAGQGVGTAAAGAAVAEALPFTAAPRAASYLGRVAQGGAGGAVQGGITGLLTKPEEGGSRLAQAGHGALNGAKYGAMATAALDPLAQLLGKGGDVGMQVSVGRRKYTPGVGTTLADEGIVGTQGMMKNQVAIS
jgi:hypothetical protein